MRCLLVDDNAAFLSSARTLLDRQGVTIVGTASTSTEALRLAAAQRPDIVLRSCQRVGLSWIYQSLSAGRGFPDTTIETNTPPR